VLEGGREGGVGWVDCSGVIIKLNSVQLQLQLPAGTELGNTDITSSLYFRSFVEVNKMTPPYQ
jgi:hypothetical protein